MRIPNVLAWCVLSLCACGAAPRGAVAREVEVVDRAAAAALTLLRATLVEMYETSPTFRRQCRRLAAAGAVPIRLHLDPRLPSASVRARAVFDRRHGRLMAADVLLPPSRDIAELVAHEIEHVLEQLDGIDLGTHAGTAAAWREPGGAFETARALAIGRRVAQEVRTGTALVLVRR